MSLRRTLLRTQMKAAGWRGKKAERDVHAVERNKAGLRTWVLSRHEPAEVPMETALVLDIKVSWWKRLIVWFWKQYYKGLHGRRYR